MYSNQLIANNATEAWEVWYDRLMDMHKDGFKQPSRAGDVVGEVLNAVTVINNPIKNMVESSVRKMSINYAVGELLWYLSGSNKLIDIKPYAKFWENISDDGETLNSAYGHRIFEKFGFNQWDYVKELLKADPYSRQAVIHIKDASNKPSKDVPCTVALQYHVREDHLYATTYMRSNDIWLGFPYDVFAFTAFQIKLAMELDLEIGTYTHIAGSLHLYERNVKNEVTENKSQDG
jgi:thymidylate synthase